MTILGAIAADYLTAPSTGPLASIDFVNGIYTVNGASQTAAQVVNLTGRITGGSGLSIIAGSPCQLLNSLLTVLLTADWTLVTEFNATTTSSSLGLSLFLLDVLDAGLSNDISVATVGRFTTSFASAVLFEGNGITTREADGNISVGLGVHKIACTVTDAGIAISMDGEAVVGDNTPMSISSWTSPPTQVQVASGNNTGSSDGFIRKFTMYSPVSNSLLPALST